MTLLLHAIEAESDGAAQTGEPLQAARTAVLLAYGAGPERRGPHGALRRLRAFHSGHGLAVRLIEAHIACRPRDSPDGPTVGEAEARG
jgi:hypothetical protein